MSADAAVLAGREAAERLMVDTCTISRPGVGEPVFDPETGQYADPDPVVVYEGRCRLQVQSVVAGSSTSTAGDRAWIVQQAELQLPVIASSTVAPNDVVTIDSAAHDPALVDRQLTVVALHAKTHSTSRRLRVKEVTG